MEFFTKSRVETFSDGIFAIIVTLLVLEIRVPHIETGDSIHELFSAMIHLLPKIVSWMISFLIVCVVWVNHHRLFQVFKEITAPLFWLNANLLLWVSFIPFPTALMGDYPRNKLAVSHFGLVLALMGASFVSLRFYIWRNPEVLNRELSKEELRLGVTRSIYFGLLLYLLGAATAWIHPYLAFACYAFIPLYYIFPSSTGQKKSLDSKTLLTEKI